MAARRILRRIMIGAGILVLVLVLYLVVLVATTPDVDHLVTATPTQTSYMRKRTEQRGSSTPDRVEWIDLDEVSPYLVCAVVKAEDGGFFRHAGFDWAQTRKAFWGYVTGDSQIGGSTITQQLARNLYLGPDRSLHRKLREALITRRLEHALDKRRILELYLNVVEWGDGVWGIKQAARVYFGREAHNLGAFEAAFLASLLPAPRAKLEGNNLRRALTVQRRVLRQLVVSAVIDSAQLTEANLRVDALSAGGSVSDVLGATTPAKPLDLSQLLANQCGLAEELAATRTRFAKARITRRARPQP
jgi:monofunctional biosynthetic peptidoglycan transglycosylase